MLSISPGASPPASPIDAMWTNENSRDRRRRARDGHELVGRQAEAEVRAEVRVQIDEARRDQAPAHVDALHGAIGRNAGRDGRDLDVANADVALGAQLLTRIEHIAV